MNEADTCRKHVVPLLQSAGWENDPHSIAEQRSITDGRIVPVGKGFMRKPPKRVDYLLCYERNFPLAVVEAIQKLAERGIGFEELAAQPTSSMKPAMPSCSTTEDACWSVLPVAAAILPRACSTFLTPLL